MRVHGNRVVCLGNHTVVQSSSKSLPPPSIQSVSTPTQHRSQHQRRQQSTQYYGTYNKDDFNRSVRPHHSHTPVSLYLNLTLPSTSYNMPFQPPFFDYSRYLHPQRFICLPRRGNRLLPAICCPKCLQQDRTVPLMPTLCHGVTTPNNNGKYYWQVSTCAMTLCI